MYLPLMFNKETSVSKNWGTLIIPNTENFKAFHSKKEAIEAAKDLGMQDPKGKVVIFQAVSVIEPRSIEFSEKEFSEAGELLV